MRFAIDHELGDVELSHQYRLVDERVVIERGEYCRVSGFIESAGDLPAVRHIEPHFTRRGSMTFGQKEKLGAGEEFVIRCDPRLIRGENGRVVIELEGDTRDPSCVDSPGLLAHKRRPQLAAARVGDSKAMEVLRVVFDHVPAGRPDRQRELERRLVDVPDVGSHVKKLTRDVGDPDRILDLKPSALRRHSGHQENVRAAGDTPDQSAA